MDLKTKFINHTDSFDEQAWDHFQLIRDQKDKKNRFLIWLVFGTGILLLVGGLYTTKYNNIATPAKKERETNIKMYGEEKENKDSALIGKISITDDEVKREEDASTELELVRKDQVGQHMNSKNTGRRGLMMKKDVQKILAERVKPDPTASRSKNPMRQGNLPKTTTTKLHGKEGVDPIRVKEPVSKLHQDKMKNIGQLPINLLALPFKEIDLRTSKLISTEEQKETSNIIKLQLGFGGAYVNGFSLQNPVNKKARSILFGYRRDLGKIIGLGISGGYIPYRDSNNPDDPLKDKEIILFFHADLYLNLVNSSRYRLYAKIGAGPVRTNRRLGTFVIDSSGTTRGFQINTLTDIGFAVEGGYEFSLSQQIMLGVFYSTISHNDGGWNAGLSMGYKF